MQEILVQVMRFADSHRWSIASVCSVLVLAILWIYPHIRSLIWSVAFVDFVVIISTTVVLVLALLKKSNPGAPKQKPNSHFGPEGLAAIAAVIAIFVTYASFRNQSRLAAEEGLNSEGVAVLELEMENPNLRCLYTNFAHNDPDGCLQELVVDAEHWSAAIFYVEETLWLLEKSEDDRQAWGSIYSNDIDYWREYVNEDPTGIFSYYLVSFYRGPDAAIEAMNRAAIDIQGMCAKYNRVHEALASASANPDPLLSCP